MAPVTRNNPAYAGKSGHRRAGCQCVWEQPRVRGEKAMHPALAPDRKGTTPRTRGKDFVTCEFVVTLSSSRLTCSHHATTPTVPGTTSDTVTSPHHRTATDGAAAGGGASTAGPACFAAGDADSTANPAAVPSRRHRQGRTSGGASTCFALLHSQHSRDHKSINDVG